MNKDVVKGKWKQFKGRAKQQWSRLTDDDLQQIEGRAEVGAGKLQERYGYGRDEAEREWNQFCDRCVQDDRSSIS